MSCRIFQVAHFAIIRKYKKLGCNHLSLFAVIYCVSKYITKEMEESMKRRKIICMMSAVCLAGVLFFMPCAIPAMAASEKGSNSYGLNQVSAEDLSGIKACESEMLEFLQDVIESSEEIPDIVDYTYLYKVYEADILGENVEQDLKEAAYSYVLDWCINGTEYEITYSIGRQPRKDVSFSENEYQELMEQAGKWGVSSIGIIDSDSISYKSAMEKCDNLECDDGVICDWLEGYGWPVIIGISENEAETIAPVYGESAYDVFSRPEAQAYKICDDNVYDYAGIYELTEQSVKEKVIESEEFQMDLKDTFQINEVVPYNSIQLAVTKYKQEKSNWCWAACAQMVGKYITKTVKEQSVIVKHVKGAVIDDGATYDEMSTAIKYATSSSSLYRYTTPDFSVIHKAVYEKVHPGVIAIVWDTGYGHSMVISGSNDSEQKMYLIDPAAGVSNAWYSYTKLKNGTTISGKSGKITRIWLIQ